MEFNLIITNFNLKKKPLKTIKHKLNINSNYKNGSKFSNKTKTKNKNKNKNKQSINYKNAVKLKQQSNQFTIEYLRSKIDKISKQNCKLNFLNTNLNTKINELNELIIELKDKNSNLEKINTKNKHKIWKRESIIEELEMKYDAKDEIVNIYCDKSDELHKENNFLTLKYTKLETENNNLKLKLTEFETNELTLRREISNLTNANSYYNNILLRMAKQNNQKEESLIIKPLQLLCKQFGWNILINDINRRSFAGYKSNCFNINELNEWYNLLTKSNEIIWNRPNNLPRKCAWFVSFNCQCCYRYGYTNWNPIIFPKWFIQITKRVLFESGLNFKLNLPNCCNVNWYENGNDSVGWHSDNEILFNSVADDCLIISLSLGQKRRFQIKLNENNENNQIVIKEIELCNGDLMSMEGLFQKYYLHRVPKEYNVSGARINLTWRWIKNHTNTCKGHAKITQINK